MKIEAAQDEGARADVVLGRRVPGLSRRAARAMALAGHLRIDGESSPPSVRVRIGQCLELNWCEPAELAPPHVLRVTEDFVYVDKPPGVHTHRLRPSDPPALADAVASLHPECMLASSEAREAGAVHRLDCTTSGVVAFARNATAWTAAHEGFGQGTVDKLYLAVCHPDREPSGALPADDGPAAPFPADALPDHLRGAERPTALRIDAPIGRGNSRKRVRIRDDGVEALTFVWPLDDTRRATSHGTFMLCLLRLCTGRRHQARVHLAHVGLPIVGDALYGVPTGADRPLLHAVRLDLSRPCPDEIAVVAPLPADMTAAIAGAAKSS